MSKESRIIREGGVLYGLPMEREEQPTWPTVTPQPIIYPPGLEDAKQKLAELNDFIEEMDEFDVMRNISRLKPDAKKRIFNWLKLFIEKE
jgi:deoxyribose-phosphate aldolase